MERQASKDRLASVEWQAEMDRQPGMERQTILLTRYLQLIESYRYSSSESLYNSWNPDADLSALASVFSSPDPGKNLDHGSRPGHHGNLNRQHPHGQKDTSSQDQRWKQTQSNLPDEHNPHVTGSVYRRIVNGYLASAESSCAPSAITSPNRSPASSQSSVPSPLSSDGNDAPGSRTRAGTAESQYSCSSSGSKGSSSGSKGLSGLSRPRLLTRRPPPLEPVLDASPPLPPPKNTGYIAPRRRASSPTPASPRTGVAARRDHSVPAERCNAQETGDSLTAGRETSIVGVAQIARPAPSPPEIKNLAPQSKAPPPPPEGRPMFPENKNLNLGQKSARPTHPSRSATAPARDKDLGLGRRPQMLKTIGRAASDEVEGNLTSSEMVPFVLAQTPPGKPPEKSFGDFLALGPTPLAQQVRCSPSASPPSPWLKSPESSPEPTPAPAASRAPANKSDSPSSILDRGRPLKSRAALQQAARPTASHSGSKGSISSLSSTLTAASLAGPFYQPEFMMGAWPKGRPDMPTRPRRATSSSRKLKSRATSKSRPTNQRSRSESVPQHNRTRTAAAPRCRADSQSSVSPLSSLPSPPERPSPQPPPRLTDRHLDCYVRHRPMLPSPNMKNPVLCMTCGSDDEKMFQCPWCGLRICTRCLQLLQDTEDASLARMIQVRQREAASPLVSRPSPPQHTISAPATHTTGRLRPDDAWSRQTSLQTVPVTATVSLPTATTMDTQTLPSASIMDPHLLATATTMDSTIASTRFHSDSDQSAVTDSFVGGHWRMPPPSSQIPRKPSSIYPSGVPVSRLYPSGMPLSNVYSSGVPFGNRRPSIAPASSVYDTEIYPPRQSSLDTPSVYSRYGASEIDPSPLPPVPSIPSWVAAAAPGPPSTQPSAPAVNVTSATPSALAAPVGSNAAWKVTPSGRAGSINFPHPARPHLAPSNAGGSMPLLPTMSTASASASASVSARAAVRPPLPRRDSSRGLRGDSDAMRRAPAVSTGLGIGVSATPTTFTKRIPMF